MRLGFLEKTGKIQTQFLVTVSELWPHTTGYTVAMVSCGVGIHQIYNTYIYIGSSPPSMFFADKHD